MSTGLWRRSPDRSVVDDIRDRPTGPTQIRKLLVRGLLLAAGVGLLYLVQQQLLEVVSSAERLRSISIGWFGVMGGAEIVSFAFMWALTRQLLPRVSWFVAATSQLVSNSVSRVVPGGAAVGGATLYRMLSISGVAAPEAASAMAASTVLSNALLFAIPAVAGLLALAGAPVPDRLVPAAFVGGVFFAVLMAVGVVAIVFTAPLRAVGRVAGRVVAILGRIGRRRWSFDAESLVVERDRLIEVLGSRWPKAIAAAAGNWAFDYLALIAALYAVGAEPRFTIVLLAYAAAAVLAMVPLTPGGVGFVEVGLYSTLVVSGIGARDAGLATIAYRLVSWWFPVVTGLLAWLAFKARYPASRERQQEPEPVC
jgi:uncharacterized protein (TIRG00374 family)